MIIGLTGGMGSGKSTITELLQQHDADIIDTDVLARQLVLPNQPAYQAIVQHFGQKILQADKTIDRRLLRQKIIDNPADRQWLEKLLHPLIRQAAKQQAYASTAKLCVVVISLLKAREDYAYIEQFWTVEAEEAVRIKRIMQRDKVDAAHAKAMMASQPNKTLRHKLADVVIYNSGNMQDLTQQVLSQLQKLTGSAS